MVNSTLTSFDDVTMRTPVSIKIDARDPLLLSEGVCHQLGIISYHPSMCPPLPSCSETVRPPDQDTKVPTVHVQLVQSVRLPPLTATIATVRLQDTELHGPLMFESCHSQDLEFADSLIHVGDDGCCQDLVANHTGFTQKLPGGSVVGAASEVDQVPVIDMDTSDSGGVVAEGTVGSGGVGQEGTVGSGGVVQEGTVGSSGVVQEGTVDSGGVVQEGTVNGGGAGRGGLVVEGQADIVCSSTVALITSTDDRPSLGALLAEVGPTLMWQHKDRLRCLLLQNHHAFAVDKGERGETDLIQMSIDTGNATP